MTNDIQNVIYDDWVTWERVSQKLIFWWHDREVRVLSYDLGGYSSFLPAIRAIDERNENATNQWFDCLNEKK